MRFLAAAIFGLMGVVAVAVAGEAIHRGRVWYRPRRNFGRDAREVRRSREPVLFWVQTGVYGGLGLMCLGLAVALLAGRWGGVR